MKKYKKPLLLLNLIIVIGLFHFSVYKKEQILEQGKLVLLPLAPVDPRSLMQGDYMVLNYDLGRWSEEDKKIPKRGFAIVQLSENNVAALQRLQASLTPLKADEIPIKYFSDARGMVRIGAESYFFEEGTADKYSTAKYGGLRVDDQGNSVLEGLYDEGWDKLKGK